MQNKGAILLHGIFRTERSMRKMKKFLEKNDYQVLNLDFPSTKMTIEQVVEFLQPQIDAFVKQLNGSVSFISYSLGGLVIRAYLHRYRPQNLFRVVMMGPPNNGSKIADFVKDWRLYKKFYGPAGQQLISNQDEFKHIFGIVDYELGIIAGNWTVEPISSLLLEWPNDGKVSVASTKIDGMTDHVIVPIAHSFFPISRRVHCYILHFLETGKFSQ